MFKTKISRPSEADNNINQHTLFYFLFFKPLQLTLSHCVLYDIHVDLDPIRGT